MEMATSLEATVRLGKRQFPDRSAIMKANRLFFLFLGEYKLV